MTDDGLTVMIVFFGPFYSRKRISTMPEWLERRLTFAAITILS